MDCFHRFELPPLVSMYVRSRPSGVHRTTIGRGTVGAMSKDFTGTPPSMGIMASFQGALNCPRYPHAMNLPSGETSGCSMILSVNGTGVPPPIGTFHRVNRVVPPIE